MIRVACATAGETAVERNARMSACVSCACFEVATFPVPIAHTGSYAMTMLLPPPCTHKYNSEEREGKGIAPPVGLLEEIDDSLQLLGADFGGLVALALLEGLADAEDNGQGRADCGLGLLRDDLRRLVEQRPPLGVAFRLRKC
jgi:hypothetical protein